MFPTGKFVCRRLSAKKYGFLVWLTVCLAPGQFALIGRMPSSPLSDIFSTLFKELESNVNFKVSRLVHSYLIFTNIVFS